MILRFLFVLIIVSNTIVLSQDYPSDSIAIAAILKTNGLSNISVVNVTQRDSGRIVSLDLSRQGLDSLVLPQTSYSLNGTKIFWGNDNDLTTVPSGIEILSSLEEIDLSRNKITHISKDLWSLLKLRVLLLSDNQIDSLDGIGSLLKLEQLVVSNNRLKLIPSEISKCSNLSLIDISNNSIDSLPSSIGGLQKLQRMYAYNNRIQRVPGTIGGCKSLIELALNSNIIKVIPDELCNLTNLKSLNLNHNLIVALPDSLGSLTSLVSIQIMDNQLSQIPSSIGGLTNLQILSLGNNKIDSLPATIGLCTAIQKLGLDSNSLVSLPIEIIKLAAIKELALEGNHLTTLPDTIIAWVGKYADPNWKDQQNNIGIISPARMFASSRSFSAQWRCGTISVQLPALNQIGEIQLSLMDLQGRHVSTLYQGRRPESSIVRINPSSANQHQLSAGTFVLTLNTATIKMSTTLRRGAQ